MQNTTTAKWLVMAVLVLFCMLVGSALPAFAHVKWFSEFNFMTSPLSIGEVVTPTYMGLVALSTIVIAGMVLVDRRLDGIGWYQRINEWLTGRESSSVMVIRAAMAAVLLISWSADAVLAPELESSFQMLVWLQFIVALLLLFPQTVALGGAGILAIYIGTVFEFGLFHMLDYLHYVGIGLYLLVNQLNLVRLRSAGLPVLYATVGFSLIWLGYEKLFYPSWSLYLLEQNPALALGFPPYFFLQGAAFVEISLGFLLLIGLLERPLAAVITLVFFTTTMVFGKVEVIGHTPLHAALVVFLLSGAGTIYKPPIAIHERLNWRVAFAAINFVLIVALFIFAYSWSAQGQFTQAMAQVESGTHGIKTFDLSNAGAVPEFTLIEVVEETPDSYDLHVNIANWTFTPEKIGQETVATEGHGHVFVNGAKVGRLYGDWYHLGELKPGVNQIVVTLNGNDHSDFVIDGQIIGAETTVTVP
ncbi:MAG: DoxX family membrane protein [Chloroflexota bacterium]